MKIIIDDKIPFIRDVFEPFADVRYISGAAICRNDLLNADALIIRTRTRCNAELLQGTNVKFIASATIGYDHIDADFCKKSNIAWTNAAGCNATSVAQYMLAVLLKASLQNNFNLKNKTIGIVGVGNVGKRIAELCNILGMNVLMNDPPRARNENAANFVALDEIIERADIITTHVPLSRSGEDATFHLFNKNNLSKLKNKIFINSSRGEVVETEALKATIENGNIVYSVIDVWEHEPNIDRDLLRLANVATPHIAGYSADGKANGTRMSVHAVANFFGLPLADWQPNIPPLQNNLIELNDEGKSTEELLNEVAHFAYDVDVDNSALKKQPEMFEQLRSNYRIRRELFNYKISLKNISEEHEKMLSLLLNFK